MTTNFKLKMSHCCRRFLDYGTESILPRVRRHGIIHEENVRKNKKGENFTKLEI